MQLRFFYGLLLLVVLLEQSACVSKKTAQSNTNKTVSANPDFSPEESNLFFDAENERLNGDPKNAIGLYANLLTRYPNNATAHFRLATLYYQRQELPNAEQHAAKAVSLQPDNKFMADFYVQVLAYQKKNKQAEQVLNDLISKNPRDYDYVYKKAMFQLRNKQFDDALKTLTYYESKTGFNEELVLQRKSIYESLGQFDKAAAELETLCKTYPESVQYRVMLIDVYEQGKQSEKAKALYLDLENNYASDPIAQVALAEYYLSINNLIRYDQYMQQVMKNKNLDVEMKVALLMPSLEKMDRGSAQEKTKIQLLAKDIVDQSPENAIANALYADVLYFNRQSDSALPYYQRSLEKDPSKLSNWHQVISIFSEQQQWDSALVWCNKTLLLFPNDPTTFFYQGLTYSMKKENKAAFSSFNHVLDLEPENPVLLGQTHAALGDLYHQENRYTESDSSYERALRFNPQDATTMNNYAYYLSLRNMGLDRAEKLSKRSLELAPETPSFLDTYAWILFQQKRYADALIWMEKCLAVSPEPDVTLLEHYGDILYKNGKTKESIDFWNRAKRLSPTPQLLDKKIKDGLPNE